MFYIISQWCFNDSSLTTVSFPSESFNTYSAVIFSRHSAPLWPFHVAPNVFLLSNAFWMNKLHGDEWRGSSICKPVSRFGYGNCPAYFIHLNAVKASVVCCVTFTSLEMLMGCRHWQPRGWIESAPTGETRGLFFLCLVGCSGEKMDQQPLFSFRSVW